MALRQKIANVLFVVARVEDAPCELDGVADRITISFPWGSLLRGAVRADPSVLVPLARLAKPGAPIEALLSVADRDGASDVTPEDLDRIGIQRGAFAEAGLVLEHVRDASKEECARTTWGKRLGTGRAARVVALRRGA
jgi:16S rRNA (adenine(1408)-N(1))-methyltransferase